MKLWQKASLLCAAVLMLVVCVCSWILLFHSKNSILALTYQRIREKQQNLATSFSEMANYHISDADSEVVRYVLVEYCFSRFADMYGVLTKKGEILHSKLSFAPQDYLPLNGQEEPAFFEGDVQGRRLLMAGSKVSIFGEVYTVYVVEDVSEMYDGIREMLWIFLAVSAGGILSGVCAMTLLLRRGARPLGVLAGTARRIAGGEYATRVEIYAQDEIGALAGDFNTMAAAVEARIAELTETAERQRLFIGGVTHEFKTPLTTLLLHAHMLRRAKMTEEERDNSLEHIEAQCAWLERLVQALLRLVTLGQEIELREASVPALFERVRQSTEKTLADRSVTLEIDCQTDTLPMDADLMQSLLVNLVDNASKAYGTESGAEEARCVYLRAFGNTLEVRDAGCGIPAEALSRVFEPFYMADKSRSKKQGGSGLGLALVKQIAGAHGAEIHMESAPGQGTTVQVLLDITKTLQNGERFSGDAGA